MGTDFKLSIRIRCTPRPLRRTPPLRLDSFDFTLLEDELRSVMFGRDDWMGAMPAPVPQLSVELHAVADIRDIEFLFAPYDSLIVSHSQCVIVNWLDHHMAMQDSGFEDALAIGLGNVSVRGNPPLDSTHLRISPISNAWAAFVRAMEGFVGFGGVMSLNLTAAPFSR